MANSQKWFIVMGWLWLQNSWIFWIDLYVLGPAFDPYLDTSLDRLSDQAYKSEWLS